MALEADSRLRDTATQNILCAPWSQEQVDTLNYFQNSGVWHPYTSENGQQLIATRDGWIEESGGAVVQTWAHASLFNRNLIDAQLNILKGTLPPRPCSE